MKHRFQLSLLLAFVGVATSCAPVASVDSTVAFVGEAVPVTTAAVSAPPNTTSTTLPPPTTTTSTTLPPPTTTTVPAPASMVDALSFDEIAEGRPVALYMPEVIGDQPRPLVVVLHGYGGIAQTAIGGFDLREAAARGRWILLAPSGFADNTGNRYWNATATCCDRDHRRNDDVGYLRQIIESAFARFPIDRTRVTVIGGSNGAFMAYQLACRASDLVTAIVVTAGAEGNAERSCQPEYPVSVFHLHGTEDLAVNFEGGELSVLEERIAPYPSAEETVRRWARRNDCPTEEPTEIPDVEAERGSWVNCALGTSVQFAWLEQGHDLAVPGSLEEDILGFIARQVRDPIRPIE